MHAISKKAQREYENSMENSMDRYIDYNRGYSGIGFFISLLFLGISLLFSHAYIMGPFMLWLVLYVIICLGFHVYFYYKLPTYTPDGQKINDEIEGFKLFLATTETDRLKVLLERPQQRHHNFGRNIFPMQ